MDKEPLEKKLQDIKQEIKSEVKAMLAVPHLDAVEAKKLQEGISVAGGKLVNASIENLKGVYTNVATISHTPREFILDFFLRIHEPIVLVSRVVTSPEHVKEIFNVLKDQIENYEEKFGKIKVEKGIKKRRSKRKR
jgi:hypothetical protein